MTHVKVCGLKTPEALEAAVTGGADFFGFIFHHFSPRHVTRDQARALFDLLPPEKQPQAVAVLVNPTLARLAELFEAIPYRWLQLHGRESPAMLQKVAAAHGVQIMKAIAVRTREDLDAAAQYRDSADMLLFDAKTGNIDMPGGMGMRFDWEVMRGFTPPLPWMLSGGITLGNVKEALAVTGAQGIDLSSALESAPGVKDPRKITEFLNYVRLR